MEEYISWREASPTNQPCDKDYGYCSSDIRYVSDPFQKEMNDETVNMNICEECYKSLLGDI